MLQNPCCSMGGKELSMFDLCQLQRTLMQEYSDEQGLERRQGAKIWVQKFSASCRQILEGGVLDTEELKQRLYS